MLVSCGQTLPHKQPCFQDLPHIRNRACHPGGHLFGALVAGAMVAWVGTSHLVPLDAARAKARCEEAVAEGLLVLASLRLRDDLCLAMPAIPALHQ